MRSLLENAGLGARIEVDSAATHSYHIGKPPDPRTQKAALKRGYDLSSLRARRVVPEDFDHFDHLLAMDADHLHLLRRLVIVFAFDPGRRRKTELSPAASITTSLPEPAPKT